VSTLLDLHGSGMSLFRILEFHKFETYQIYVSSWLSTLVRKPRHQTKCGFLSNFETRVFVAC
jgi:hypothetical protein